jgi:hypothetical protein
VHFDGRYADRLDGVVERIGVVGEGARVDDDPVGGPDRLMQPIDQGPFVVLLERADRHACGGTPLAASLFELPEGDLAVDVGTAGAEEVQIRSVHDEYPHNGQAIS